MLVKEGLSVHYLKRGIHLLKNHGKYSAPLILAMIYGMIINGWGGENDGPRIFTEKIEGRKV